jgi:hypothetical protein
MSDPSITSGESIILTTHRVSFNAVLYNMILTTRRLILVDSGDSGSQPRTIPLARLQSAAAGDGTGGEPLLILSFGSTAGTGQPGPMNLSFPQHFAEDRKRERNEWIKKLNKHSASARGENIVSKLWSAPGTVMRLFGAARIRNGEPSGGTVTGTEASRAADAPDKGISPPAERPVMPGEDSPLHEGTVEGSPWGALSPPVYVTSGSADTGTPVHPAGGEGGIQPAVPTISPIAGSSPAPPPRHVGKPSLFTVALVIIIIVGMAAGAFLYFQYVTAKSGGAHAPVVVPESTVRQVPVPTPAIIPAEGTWVRVEYNGTFVGWVGTPGFLRHVGGSGEQIYPIRNDTRYVQASFQKQDYSGKTLAVEVYAGGVMTYRRTVRSPMGEIAFLIDPRTAEQPGVTPVANQTGK